MGWGGCEMVEREREEEGEEVMLYTLETLGQLGGGARIGLTAQASWSRFAVYTE